MHTLPPYIGVTGFMNREQVDAALCDFPRTPFLKLMVGVLASDKTMAGLPNNHPGKYPHQERIANIFSDDPRAFNLVHYNTHDQKDLARQLDRLFEAGGIDCHGAQLNISWPNPDELVRSRRAWSDKQIVLQLGSEAFNGVKLNPEMLAKHLRQYVGLIDYVLFDMSGGLGVGLDIQLATNCFEQYLKLGLNKSFGFGLAGGLSAETVGALAPLFRASRNLSIDAEGRLRTDDCLDTAKTRAYLAAAAKLYKLR